MNPKIKKAWVAALRSGEYKQTRVQLRSKKNAFCCLGVLCNLHAQAHPRIAAQQTNPQTYMGSASYLSSDVMHWAGLHMAEGAQIKMGEDKLSLAELNDWKHLNFSEIADLIEEHLLTATSPPTPRFRPSAPRSRLQLRNPPSPSGRLTRPSPATCAELA